MSLVSLLVLLLFIPSPLLAQQAFPLPLLPQTQTPTVIYGPNGERSQTFPTPDGGTYTVLPDGHTVRGYQTPDGGHVFYDSQGQQWRLFPSPADRNHQLR
jgi:hypothetical protein